MLAVSYCMLTVVCDAACGGQGVTTNAAQVVYAGQLQECVQASATRAEYELCRDKAIRQWAPLTGHDAGAIANIDASGDAGKLDILDAGKDGK
jgi:hypothetical protein